MPNFDPRQVAICAITYYPKWYQGKLRSIKHTDKVRGDLALEFAQEAVKRGYQVVIVDGKSSKTFKKSLAAIAGVIIKRRKTQKRSPNKRLAYKIASKLAQVKVIVATEPEKTSLVTDCLPQIVRPILKEEADIVVPKRNDQLFQAAYPDYMYHSEIEGNQLYNENLKLHKLLKKTDPDLDMFFGARAFANEPKVLSLFMRKFKVKASDLALPKDFFDAEEYSNTTYFPIVLALKKKLRVKSVEIPFKYPQIQKRNEEAQAKELFLEKRRTQRLSLLLELMHFLNYLDRR